MTARNRLVMALFGEAEKGQFQKAYVVKELSQLMEYLGNPPGASQGIPSAIQALLYQRELIYFRVEEEGFSIPDYFFGLNHLEHQEKTKHLHAIYMPGMGEKSVVEASTKVCLLRNSSLIMSEKDLYDYLTT